MLKSVFVVTALAISGAAFAKLPAPALTEEAKTKAAEAAAKTAHGNKVASFQLCKSMDKAAAHYYRTTKASGKEAKPAVETPACADPGAFVFPVPAAPAGAAAVAGAPAAVAAVAPAVAAAPKVAAPVAAGKSPAEMIKAMREGAAAAKSDAAVAIAEPVVAKPKLPAKAAAGKKQELPRRSFPGALFAALCVPYYMAWTLLSAIGGLWGLGMARFMMPNTVLELPSKFKVGSIGDYPLGTVSEKYKATRAVWIVHTDGYDGQNVIYALLSVCTHLGCTPSWLDAEQKFKCPCHGSGFYINGVNFEGPAPRPLERVGLVLGADGVLEVDKSVKFQEELGQWNDPKSFVKV